MQPQACALPPTALSLHLPNAHQPRAPAGEKVPAFKISLADLGTDVGFTRSRKRFLKRRLLPSKSLTRGRTRRGREHRREESCGRGRGKRLTEKPAGAQAGLLGKPFP